MRFYLSLYLFIAGFYLLTASGRIGRMSDSTTMFHVAQNMITERSLSSEPCDPRYDDPDIGSLCVRGKDGRYYSAYGFVPSLAVVPAILCARAFSRVVHFDSVLIAKASVSFFTLLVAPLSCVVLAMWILKLGYSRRTAILGACLLAFGSPFWHNSVSGFLSEPYFILALVVAAYLLSGPRIRYACALSGFAFGVACGTRVAGVALAPAYLLSLAFQVRARKLPWMQFLRDAVEFSVPVAAWGGLIAWTNYIRFGSIFKTGYHNAFPTLSFTFSNPLFHGTRDLLFRGEQGLLLFAPWVVLSFLYFPQFMRKHPPEAVLCGALFLINFIFYAKFYAWYGGWAGGPRYLLPALPFVIMAIAPILEAIQRRAGIKENQSFWALQRALVILLLASGFIIQAVTLTYPRDRYYADLVFYSHNAVKPWWYGSIPLAALDYWARTSIPKTEAHYTEPARSRTVASVDSDSDPFSYWKHSDAVATEDEFMNWLPHPENATLPELMVLKRRLMGLPAKVMYGYLLAVLIIILTGAVGLKRYRGPQGLRGSAPLGGPAAGI
jgi:hypothetical protein